MSIQRVHHFLRQHALLIALCSLFVLLVAKFFYAYFAFDTPLGYDPGMYRYLFIKYADAFPPLIMPELRPWAQEYPYGLFIFSSILMRIGIPVSWFMGWIWSAMPIVLLGSLAWIFSKKEGPVVGVLILLFGLLSLAFYDGFAAMYWKTFLAMFFLILALYAFERNSLWMLLFGVLTMITHNQTGLIFALVLIAWWLLHLPTHWRDRTFRKWTLIFVSIACIGLAFYAPIWFRAFWAPFRSVLLLRGDSAPGGEFPPLIFFVQNAGILLAFGVAGWIMSFRKERFNVWQLAVAVCAIFVLFKLVFYRRFFLQLDFFLLPFAAIALRDVYQRFRNTFVHGMIIVLLVVQIPFSYNEFIRWRPQLDEQQLMEIQSISQYIEPEARVIALENLTAVWLLGWMPQYYTGGPGLFDFPAWTYEDWEAFLYGEHEDRLHLLSGLERPLYFMTSRLFFEHYGNYIKPFLADPCFEEVEGAPLLRVVCLPNKG